MSFPATALAPLSPLQLARAGLYYHPDARVRPERGRVESHSLTERVTLYDRDSLSRGPETSREREIAEG